MSYTEIDAATVAAIVAELPGEWETQQDYAHSVTTTRADGLVLWWNAGYGNGGKVEVAHSLGAYGRELTTYGVERATANVTLTRPVDVLARDLTRRLLPVAEAAHAEMLARAERHASSESAKTGVREALGAIPGVTVSGINGGEYVEIPGQPYSTEVQIADDGVRIGHRHGLALSTDDAVAVLTLLAERHGATR